MKVITNLKDMQRYADDVRAEGLTLAFVPTMGFLHEGHATLMRTGRKRAQRLVVSIFVNPTQFGPHEDFDNYPRDARGDEALCRDEGVDVIFMPPAEEMYPPGAQTWVEVSDLSRDYCGASRPEHFRGVATIVTKLFLAVKPHVALFGQKDYQQLAVIRRMTRDLNFDIEIVGVPTVREPSGLALSSRNKYLSDSERERALALSRGLRAAADAAAAGIHKSEEILTPLHASLQEAKAEIDYVRLVDPLTLEGVDSLDSDTEAVILVAARIGTTRLIDNLTIRAASLAAQSSMTSI